MRKTEEPLAIPMLPMVRETLWRLKRQAGDSPFGVGDSATTMNIKRAFYAALSDTGWTQARHNDREVPGRQIREDPRSDFRARYIIAQSAIGTCFEHSLCTIAQAAD